MSIKLDAKRLDRALCDFSLATGININFIDDLSEYRTRNEYHAAYCRAVQSTPEGKARCACSDESLFLRCKESRAPEMHICHAGLVDLAVPIFYNEQLLGYLIFGQMRTDIDIERVRGCVSDLPTDTEMLIAELESMPICSDEKIKGITNVAVMLTKYVLLEKVLKPVYDESLSPVIEYIEENYASRLSVLRLCRDVGISKTSLYRLIRQHFGYTVGDLINSVRIEKSLKMLENRTLSIDEVSRLSGFSSAAYYSKLFKRKKGISPSKHRKGVK